MGQAERKRILAYVAKADCETGLSSFSSTTTLLSPEAIYLCNRLFLSESSFSLSQMLSSSDLSYLHYLFLKDTAKLFLI